VEEFWRRLARSGIDIKRRDDVKDVLARKRIKDVHEYDTIVDSLVVLQQIGKLTKDDAARAQQDDR
jgi:hypothetical protein